MSDEEEHPAVPKALAGFLLALSRRAKCPVRHPGATTGVRSHGGHTWRSDHRPAVSASVTLAQPRATTSPPARATYNPSISRPIRMETRSVPGAINPA